MNITNSTQNSTVINLDVQYIQPFDDEEEEPIEEEYEEPVPEPEAIHFNPHSRNISVHHHNWTAPVNNETHIRGGSNEHQGHHHKHNDSPLAEPIQRKSSPSHYNKPAVDPNMQDFQDKLTSIGNAEQAKEIAHYYIGMGINASFFWMLVIGVLIQYCYISSLKKMGKNQKQLEEVFMGPEIIARPTASAADAPAIQYIVVPASQYPSYVNPGQTVISA